MVTQKPISPEAFAEMAALGFVAIRSNSGIISFAPRDIARKSIATGLARPVSPPVGKGAL